MSRAAWLERSREFAAFARAPEREFPELRGFFAATSRLSVARAPGRLDVMGGIADYSGALVLEMPIREAAYVAAAEHPEPRVRVVSVSRESQRLRAAEFPLEAVRAAASAGYDDARRLFTEQAEHAWAAYVAGAAVVLGRECDRLPERGLSILLVSEVPEGKGVSSSAAIEVAALCALSGLYGISLEPSRLGLLGQTLENRVVGAPCGVMDQMTAACGESERLLELLCQPARILGMRSVPAEIGFFGIDSGVRHAVGGADYGQVRCAAFMGYRILADALGLPAAADGPGRVRIDDTRYGGYLANIAAEEFLARYRALLPERLLGRDFLERYTGITDAVTRVDPERSYPVRAATEHPVLEQDRIQRFRALLDGELSDGTLSELGALMYGSHDSYSACGLGSSATDELVRRVREASPASGLFGAKITGGGSGGTVAVLARREAEGRVRALAEDFGQRTGRAPLVFSGSSPGAALVGVLEA